jgi:hypothetical protein
MYSPEAIRLKTLVSYLNRTLSEAIAQGWKGEKDSGRRGRQVNETFSRLDNINNRAGCPTPGTTHPFAQQT